ncbi:MAG: hypothetical protein IJV37_07045 [Bacteroidales bacterium]|nr:hypothetical protein [Bacteroidales bacterium]
MRKLFCILLFCTLALPASAQRTREGFAWEYDADFQFIFDNREFAFSKDAVIPSGTLNVLVLAPTVGFSFRQSHTVHHRLSAGVELAHDLGSGVWSDIAREALIYYDAHVRTRHGTFEGLAGIFPRRFLEGYYSEAFFSGLIRNTDRNLEGILLKWRSERFFAELGADWMGQYGQNRRERFQLMSSGRWSATPWLSLGWTGSFYHFAGSELAPNAVDNHLLEPWLKLDAAGHSGWDELSLRAALLAGYQRDRAQSSRPTIPLGGDVMLTARRWGLTLQNETFFGGNLLPLLGQTDPAGNRYGTDLYFCLPTYNGFYDRVELNWMPRLNRFLTLRLAVRAHFGREGFLGWQQQFYLRFSLDALRHRDIVSGRCL